MVSSKVNVFGPASVTSALSGEFIEYFDGR
jgi:hypothetical protein